MCLFKGNASETGSQGLCAPIKGKVVGVLSEYHRTCPRRPACRDIHQLAGLHQPRSYHTTAPDTYVQNLVRRGGRAWSSRNTLSQHQSPIMGSCDGNHQATVQQAHLAVRAGESRFMLFFLYYRQSPETQVRSKAVKYLQPFMLCWSSLMKGSPW